MLGLAPNGVLEPAANDTEWSVGRPEGIHMSEVHWSWKCLRQRRLDPRIAGLAERDRAVFLACRDASTRCLVRPWRKAHADPIRLSAEAHAATFCVAAAVYASSTFPSV